MNIKVDDVLRKTDWKYLARQKQSLIEAARNNNELEGLLNWVDAIQDAAELEGHPVVWLSEEHEPSQDGSPQ